MTRFPCFFLRALFSACSLVCVERRLISSVRIINFFVVFNRFFLLFIPLLPLPLFISFAIFISLAVSLSRSIPIALVSSHSIGLCLPFTNSLPIISNMSFIFDDKSPIVALKQLTNKDNPYTACIPQSDTQSVTLDINSLIPIFDLFIIQTHAAWH